MKKRGWRQIFAAKVDEAGQSTVEFALTLFLLMGFILFYLQLSLMMGFANYAHYATFMAARAYLSAGPSHDDQVERAKQVITRMLKKSQSQSGVDRFPMIAKGTGGGDPAGADITEPEQFKADDPSSSWMQGVRYTFKSRLFLMPMGTGAAAAKAARGTVTLKSESWLGREPAYDECQGEMGRVKGIFDNGC